MKSIENTALQLLVAHWHKAYELLGQLQLVDAKPSDGYGLFALSKEQRSADAVSFDVGPITFFLPERAGQTPELYVVVRALLHLDKQAVEGRAIRTKAFGTEVGYFREKHGKLLHVYGAHYDFSLNEIGHPIFHAQLKSYLERGQWVADHFELAAKVDSELDYVKGLLNRVRVPTAQMDFFALILQLVADHLIDKTSREEDLEVFSTLRKEGQKIQGAGHRLPDLKGAPGCMRAYHWYSDEAKEKKGEGSVVPQL